MKKAFPLSLLALTALFLVIGSAQAETPISSLPKVGEKAEKNQFAKSIEDLPVMPGLEVLEDKELLFIFGKERIAQTSLKGPVPIDDVYYFYWDVLPSLGWKKINPKLFERGGEQLRFEASTVTPKGMTLVTFEVKPSAAQP